MDSPGEFVFWLKQQVFQEGHTAMGTGHGVRGPEEKKKVLLLNMVPSACLVSSVCLVKKKINRSQDQVPVSPLAPFSFGESLNFSKPQLPQL